MSRRFNHRRGTSRTVFAKNPGFYMTLYKHGRVVREENRTLPFVYTHQVKSQRVEEHGSSRLSQLLQALLKRIILQGVIRPDTHYCLTLEYRGVGSNNTGIVQWVPACTGYL